MQNLRILLSVVTLLVFTLAGHSQTEKGNFLAGGSLNFAKGPNLFSASLSPAVSYFIKNRFAGGIIVPLTFTNRGSSAEYDKVFTCSIGPTIRYYFPVASQWALFPQIDYAYGWYHEERATDIIPLNGVTASSSNLFRFGFGSTYFITKSVGLEGVLYWQSIYSARGYVDSSLNFRVGFQVYLAKRIVDKKESR